MTCAPTYCGRFLNTYLVDRAYGGPEEGGWWYDTGEAIFSVQYVDDDALDAALDLALLWCKEENANRRSDVSSVLSEGRYVVCVEDEPARDYPAERPHYE